MKVEGFDAFLRSLLDRGVEPPSARVVARGGKRTRVELGDFSGHSPYLPGDDLRFLDWKALARSGQKVLRTFDEVRHRRLVLLIDASRSMGTRAPALRLLLRLWCFLALHRLDSLEVLIARDDGVEAALYEGSSSFSRLDRQLEELEFRGSAGLAQILSFDAVRSDESAVVVSDFWPEEDAIELMRRARYEDLRLLLVYPRLALESSSPLSRAATLPSGRLRIEDPEGHDVLEVESSAALHEAFRAEQGAWEARLRAQCARYGHALLAGDLPQDERAACSLGTWMPFLSGGAPRSAFRGRP